MLIMDLMTRESILIGLKAIQVKCPAPGCSLTFDMAINSSKLLLLKTTL